MSFPDAVKPVKVACRSTTFHNWLNLYETNKTALIYIWPTLFNLATCLSCILSILLLFMLWFCTYFNISMLVTQRNLIFLYQSVQIKTSPPICLFHVSAEHLFSSFFVSDRLTINKPLNSSLSSYSIYQSTLCFRLFTNKCEHKYLFHIHFRRTDFIQSM